MPDTALAIMVRYPEKGKIKTRLARSIGNDATLHLYRAFLCDLAQRFSSWTYDLHWAYTPTEHDFAAFVATLVPEYAGRISVFPQQGPDLGTRLYQVFHTLQMRQFRQTIVIGSDSPQISRATLLQAQQALDIADVVLGPAEDGGYYLIAMREPHEVFSGIPMSTKVVLQMTIERAEAQGLSVHLLEPLFDIDEQPDLIRLAELLQQDTTLAPYTATCLAEMKKEYVYDCDHRNATTFDIY
jgi:rSAM/selenodomain-associated transferase 1